MPGRIAALALSVLALSAGSACAQADLFSPETVHGLVDVRLEAADGERSFVDGGYGKTRVSGGAGGDFTVHARLAEAAIEWKPRLNWEWSAVVDAIAQPGLEHAIDLDQAYLVFKPVPRSSTRFQFRGGYFYPPISLEHDGPVWGLTNTITPSAINSWVGEEVKVVGFEGQVTHDFGDQSVALTGGVFGYDDTSGTLLTYRGWALHDLQSTANGAFELPPLSAFGRMVQDDETYSNLEIDNRLGYYVRAEWRPVGPVMLYAIYYDNRGNLVGVTPDVQWAWKTDFVNVGASVQLGEHTRALGQVLVGRTAMGFPTPDGLFADVSYRAGYGLISHDVGPSTFTGRVDVFQATDRSVVVDDNNDETGWALTAAWRRTLGRHADLRMEALHVWSRRPSRTTAGVAPEQSQTVIQTSLRLSF